LAKLFRGGKILYRPSILVAVLS